MKVRKGLSSFVLLCLEKSVDGAVRINDFAYHHYRYHYGIPDLKQSSLSKALQRLREGGLIEFVSDQELAVRLTDKGKEQAVLEALRIDDEKWDKIWRLVIFDIPEKRRAARDLLRSKLKEWGFMHLQKSVWVSKKNCTLALRNFVKKVGIEDWVMVIEFNNLGRDI